MPDTQVYAVANGKGGVGKTTAAVNLGAALAAAGESAVVVDADLGMANVGEFLGLDADGATLHDALAGSTDATTAATEGPGGFDVVLGDPGVEGYGAADPAALADAVADLRGRYDVVVLDTGAGLSHDTLVPLGVADEVLLATTPDPAAVQNATKTAELVARFDGSVRGVVVQRVDGGDPEAAVEDLDAPLLAAVPEDDAVPASAAAGLPVVDYDPDSPAGAAYRGLAAALLGETDPVPVPGGGDDGTPEDDADPGTPDDGEILVAADDPQPSTGENDGDDADGGPADDDDPGAEGDESDILVADDGDDGQPFEYGMDADDGSAADDAPADRDGVDDILVAEDDSPGAELRARMAAERDAGGSGTGEDGVPVDPEPPGDADDPVPGDGPAVDADPLSPSGDDEPPPADGEAASPGAEDPPGESGTGPVEDAAAAGPPDDGATGDETDAEDTVEDESTASRSLLSRLTGGLLG